MSLVILNSERIRSFFKKIFFKIPLGRKLIQFFKAISLLRVKSFRILFLEVNKNDICIDLGANIGNASLVMWLKGVRKIYALEPNIEAFKILNKNLFGIRNISTLNMAISKETRKENLFLHRSIKEKSDVGNILKFSQASSLLSNKTNVGKTFYEVQAITLNDLLSDLKVNPSIIKCDIEGGEYLIYKQLIEYGKSKEVRKIFVECHASKYIQYKEKHRDFIKLIADNKLENIIDTHWH